jgi:hypothetical protein
MSFSTSSPTSPSNKTWKFLKEEGKQQFKNGEYTEALVSFQKALKKIEDDPTGSQRRIGILAPKVEREILLSNSVACRLKIGGPEMAYVAVEEAKKVSLMFDFGIQHCSSILYLAPRVILRIST